MVGVFLDLKKAFDTVNHDILLLKIYAYGIRGNIYDWFKSYLKNRKQFVFYNNTPSDIGNITHGVPQGSILGPLLCYPIHERFLKSVKSAFQYPLC